ncbi:MAG TPA: gliding motility-associated C-terminal domain-containing protein, partial [bacterium]|nr:gliding motility-associated C-terminal domain-containing protein [bacterium]
PQLVNATVDVTDAAAGQTTVRWTVGSPGPHVGTLVAFYRLFRAADDAPALVLLRDRIPLDDTVYVDTNLNTADRQYQYRVVMVSEYAGSAIPVIDTAAAATTPRLRTQIQSIGPQIDVFWRYQVPWDNVSWHYVYRRIAGTYELIDSVFAGNAGGFYSDRFTYRGLPIDHEPVNCYRILTRGSYVVGQRDPAPTVNWSQETCVKNMPCAPLLALEAPDCAAEAAGCDPGPYANQLTWTPDFTPPCARDLTGYRVYFRPTPESPWTLLATTTSPSFRHEGLPTRLGCYSVTAVDASGSESPRSNEVCPDNCVYFTLPNIVTPNADGINDRLQPLCASPLRRVRFTVYNRWGRRVYESDANPLIQWSGTADNGQPLTDGTYFYRAEVEFDALNPVPRFYKGWVDIAGSRASAAGR